MADRIAMKLGLGTVQFGMAYGVSNSRGQVPEPEAAEMLDLAAKSGVRVLDTAQAYGDSEAVLGRILSAKHDFHIVTKIAPGASRTAAQSAQSLRTGFRRSLERLRQNSVYALLCHDSSQLLGIGGQALWREMTALRDEGRVRKIGVSVYTRDEITQLLAAFEIEIIQLPFNLLDQRLLKSGVLQDLKRRGIEIHARSTFLQGLLLSDPRDLDACFAPLRGHLAGMAAMLRGHDLTALSGALACSLQREEIDTVLVGITSPMELSEIFAAMAALPTGEIDFSPCALDDERFLNPSYWNSFPKVQSRRSQSC
jgi:aryl-alcohol dehydrogenase-like predicted oxidoreductase